MSESYHRWNGTVKDYRMSLKISFILKLKGVGRIARDGLWSCLSFINIIEVRR